jgi:hypothetical protein
MHPNHTNGNGLYPSGGLHTHQVTVEVVSQADLEAFLELERQGYRHTAERKKLIELLDGGAWIEPGPISARLDRRPHHILSEKTLAPILGSARVQQLVAAVEPSIWRHLIVTRR